MASDWITHRIEQVGKVITGKTPPTSNPEYYGGPYPFITIPDMNQGPFLLTSSRTVSEAGAQIIRSSMLPQGAVLMSCIATVGRCGITTGVSFTNQQINAVIPNELVDPLFLYYVFTQLGTSISAAGGGGSVYTNVSKSRFGKIEISIPECRQEQARIAQFLGSLDRRITLLRDTNATLEAIAQALFKSWFVDFAPVHAKAEGRETEDMDAATAALFPSELEDSELGPIPKGWRVGTLEDVSDLNASKWTARKHPEIVKYIDLSGVNRNRIETFTEFEFDAAPRRARNHLREGDTIVGTVRPGNRAYAYIHAPEENLTGSTGFAVLSPKPYLSSFVYLAATSDEAIERFTNLADGAAYPAVRPGVVASTPCVLPSDSVLAAFAEISVPMLEGIAKNSTRAEVLAELRDTLLPRLISGKLRLPEAEREIEAATT